MIYFVIAVTLIGFVSWLAFNYKSMVLLGKSIQSCEGRLKEALLKRQDSVRKLSEALGEECRGRPELFGKLNEALAKAHDACGKPLKEREAAENELGDGVGRLLQELQNDRQLKERDAFTRLRDDVLDSLDAVELAEGDYNDLVARFNFKRTIAPAKYFVEKAGMARMDEFVIEDVFARYPLQIKATLPSSSKSILLERLAPETGGKKSGRKETKDA